mgnify:CR=1 FL=1
MVWHDNRRRRVDLDWEKRTVQSLGQFHPITKPWNHGDPHRSSSLGNLPILDFRVQVATSENFEATKPHWSFRLQSRRPLKKLMVTTDGCNQRSAGIGNISYVKDLQTYRVVTTNLRCSKFGIAYSSSSYYGWPQMNSCLAKPWCLLGFAFHSKVVSFKLQLDNSGAFSYSTTGSISGMDNNATAFVGCDNDHCCGCYGPVGRTKDILLRWKLWAHKWWHCIKAYLYVVLGKIKSS